MGKLIVSSLVSLDGGQHAPQSWASEYFDESPVIPSPRSRSSSGTVPGISSSTVVASSARPCWNTTWLTCSTSGSTRSSPVPARRCSARDHVRTCGCTRWTSGPRGSCRSPMFVPDHPSATTEGPSIALPQEGVRLLDTGRGRPAGRHASGAQGRFVSLHLARSGVSWPWSGRSRTGVRGRPPRPWRAGRRRPQVLLPRPRWRRRHVGHMGRLPARSVGWLGWR